MRDTDGQHLHNSLSTPHNSGAQYTYPGFSDRSYGNANDYSQYQEPYSNFQPDRSVLRNRQYSESVSPFAQHNDHGLLRGIEDMAEATSPSVQGHELVRREVTSPHDAPSPYMMSRRSESVASRSPALLPMASSPQTSLTDGAGQGIRVLPRNTKYEPCPSRLDNSAAAREYRRQKTQFNRVPYRVPETDDTIEDIENNRRVHVERIYNAMTSGEKYRDNPTSIAVKRWVVEAHYPADLVEAYAHKVFDCLLEQVKRGFRGWPHNDYVADERKGEEIDRAVDCAGRLNNVIESLEFEKTICEDVLNSACQIRTFVNAPKAYANRKHQNRLGNSKRGRAKDATDDNPKPAKARRTGGKRTTARSNTTPDVPASRGNTPQYQQQQMQNTAPMPYYRAANNFSNLSPSPITSSYPPPRSMPNHRPNASTATAATHSSFGQQSLAAMSPPPASLPRVPHASQLQIARTATVQPHHQSPMMTPPPPPLSHNSYYPHTSATATQDEAKPVTEDATFTGWRNAGPLDVLPYEGFQQLEPAVDPSLTPWNFGLHSEHDNSSSFFDHTPEYVNPANLERRHSLNGVTGFNFDDFSPTSDWDAQHGGHGLPPVEGSSEHKH